MSEQDFNYSSRRQARGRSQSTLSGLGMILGSSYCDMLLGIVRGILVMRAIGPTARGLMRLVHLFGRYLSNSHVGTLHGLSKELPLALGRDDHEDATHIENVGTSAVVLLATLASGGMLAWALLGPGMQGPTRLTLALGAGIILGGQAIALYRVVLRAWGTYSVLAVATIVTSLGQFGLIVAGAVLFGLMGAMWGWLTAVTVTLLYFGVAGHFYIRPRLDLPMLWRLIRVGVPIAGVLFSSILLRTIDGVLVVKYFDAYRFGLYSVAMQIAAYLYRIPEAAGFVLMPRIWERYGADHRTEALRDYVIRPTLAAGLIMPILAGFVFIMMPPMIRTIIPRFAPAIFAAQVLSLAAVFLALPVAADGALIAFNEERIVIVNKLAGAAVAAAGMLVFLEPSLARIAIVIVNKIAGPVVAGAIVPLLNPGLSRIAIAAAAGYAVTSILTLYIVLGRYYSKRLQLWRELAVCYLPLLWTIIALQGSGAATDWMLGTSANMWADVALRCLYFGVLVLPILWYAERRTNLLKEVRRRATEALRKRLASQEMEE